MELWSLIWSSDTDLSVKVQTMILEYWMSYETFEIPHGHMTAFNGCFSGRRNMEWAGATQHVSAVLRRLRSNLGPGAMV